jgi:hypothetical protein
MSVNEDLADALDKASAALRGSGPLRATKKLNRGGVHYEELELSDAELVSGKTVPWGGHGIRFLRHGSNPGARLEVSFGGTAASRFFAPGQVIRGGFDAMSVKTSAGGARVGKAAFAILNEWDTDLAEDLIISALGPIDLLGSANPDDPTGQLTFVTVPENTEPNDFPEDQLGAFDGSGWELLRVMVSGTDLESASIQFFANHSPNAETQWAHCTLDGVYTIENVTFAPLAYGLRTFMVPWAGRGFGCPAVYSLLPAGLTGLGFIIQGIR